MNQALSVIADDLVSTPIIAVTEHAQDLFIGARPGEVGVDNHCSHTGYHEPDHIADEVLTPCLLHFVDGPIITQDEFRLIEHVWEQPK